jgi:hypothetical protein
MRLSSVLLASALAGGACTTDLDPLENARVECSASETLCPQGTRCDSDVGFCLPIEPAEEAVPRILDVSVDPNPAGPNAALAVRFSVDATLLVPPQLHLQIAALDQAFTLSESSDSSFVFRYELQGLEPEGTATLVADIVTLTGYKHDNQLVATVDLDFTPVAEPDVDIVEGIEHLGALWVDQTNLTLALTLADAEIPAGVQIAGDVTAVQDVDYAASIPFETTAGDGSKLIDVSLWDQAGNEARVSVPVRLQTSLPTNTVLIDEPASTNNEVWLNADSLSIFFHSSDVLPPDFHSYVVSTDQGTTWQPVMSLGSYSHTSLTQNSTTEIWLRESDLFGNLTSEANQAVLIVHEDSEPPTPPLALARTIIGNLGSEAGVYVTPSHDTSGEVTYELLGGPYDVFTPVDTVSRIVLPAVPMADFTSYLVRTVDRAGNSSLVSSVVVADTPLKAFDTGCMGGAPGCTRWSFRAREDRGLFSERTSTDHHTVGVCAPDTPETLLCDFVLDIVDAAHTGSRFFDIDLAGRNVIYGDEDEGLWGIDLGPDRLAGTGDEGTATLIASDGNCFAAAERGVAYQRSSDKTIYFYDFGTDGVIGQPGTGGEGSTVVTSTANPSSCLTRFNGRYIIWFETGNEYWIFDLGPDHRPGGGDDVGELYLSDNGAMVLGESGLYLKGFDQPGVWTDFGADGAYGTNDDMETLVEGVQDVHGDKLVIARPNGFRDLYDLSSDTWVRGVNEAFNHGLASTDGFQYELGEGLFFGPMSLASPVASQPALYQFRGQPFAFMVSEGEALGDPSGAFSGDFIYLATPGQESPYVLNDQLGGAWPLTTSSPSLTDVDISGCLLVYLDDQGRVVFYSAGADQIPNTEDDRGPSLITPDAGYRRWPRIDGHTIIWADMNDDDDGNWIVTMNSKIKAYDLGDDGTVGGGDDTSFDVTTGGKEILPDIWGDLVVYLDYSFDPSGECEDIRGSPDPANCRPRITAISLSGGGTQAIETDTIFRVGLQFDGTHLVWTQYRYVGPSEAYFDVYVHRMGGSTIALAADDTQQIFPTIDGNRIAYIEGEPTVIDAGPDALFGTQDDLTLRSSPGWLGCARDERFTCEGFAEGLRPTWLHGDWMLLGSGMMPVEDGAEVYRAKDLSLSIPDTGNPVSHTMILDAELWQWVESMSIEVDIDHPMSKQLTVSLISPSYDEVVLFDQGWTGKLSQTFDLSNTPALVDHYGEPLAGTWTLQVIDNIAGSTGTLRGWTIRHKL